jgi:anhydro-N-acetylmuramic acid kinase
MEPIWTIGLMTGTVLDGNIDIAMIKTDGETIAEFGPYTLAPYSAEVRALLEETLAAARAWTFEGAEPEIFARAAAGPDRRYAPAGRWRPDGPDAGHQGGL